MKEIKKDDLSMKIGGKAFIFSASIILVLMIFSGLLTRILPAGLYDRIVSEGRTLVVDGSYREIARPLYPIWRWFTAPVEILFGPDSLTPIVLLIFISVVGGSIAVLENSGVMKALIDFLVTRFAKRKYTLIVVMIAFFMFITGFVGIYEGMIPMIIFVIPVAIALGWDSLTGLGISLLPLAFGFSASVTNPFTIAVAQKIADLPLFSGAFLRIIFFLVIFALVCFFVIRHARKVEKNPESSICYREDEILRKKMLPAAGQQPDVKNSITKGQWRALVWFTSWIVAAILLVVSTARIPGLSDLAFPLMTVFFLIGGMGGGFFSGFNIAEIARAFAKGVLGFLPGIVLVMMAYSVKHIITEGMIMDTILYRASEIIRQTSSVAAAFMVYATTLVLEFFIGSASAKAFLMMPILTPLADLVGITRQTAIMAFNFGDGFSNMIFPTNALLLIALSFTVISYPKWIRWTWKLQLVILVITSIFLVIAVKTGYGPF
ncbi:MAG: AbgT family transporter [Treponema sp.]|nr:AbgT family transporter [Treponema sp.]MCL2272232.1 AbgT family transporter [Treponema sp.]